MTGAHDASISHAGSPGAGGKAGHQGHSAGGTINGQSGHGQSTTGNRRTSLLSEEAMRWDGHLSDKGEEFAVHLGIDLENPEDRQHAWIAETAVNEVLPDGWSQHEDEEGFLYFYDAVMDRSSWEHPREGHWRRTLDDERRRIQREKELSDMEHDIEDMVSGPQGEKMMAELRSKFLKVDIAELEAEMELVRNRIEDVVVAVQGERGQKDDEASRRRVYMMQRQGERLRTELVAMEARMKDMVQKMHVLLQTDGDDDPAEVAARLANQQAPVTPEAVKEMCEYFGINIYSEPHLIYIAKKALEDPLPPGWEEQQDANGDPIFVEVASGEVQAEHPLDNEFFDLVAQKRGELAHMELSLFNDPWIKFVDTDSVPYYYNFRTDDVVFERPMDAQMRAATRIQARARGIQERERLEKLGFHVKRVEAPKVSAAKAKLVAQLHQNQMDAELARVRKEALEREVAEMELKKQQEEEARKARAEEEAKAEREKQAMLEALRRKQERDDAKAKIVQKVFRGHMVRKRVELPWETRERMANLLQYAWLCHVAREKLLFRRSLEERRLAAKAQVEAVTKLQSVYRGHLARVDFAALMDEDGPRMRQERAARCLQGMALRAVYRGAYAAAVEELTLMAEAHLKGEDVPEVEVGGEDEEEEEGQVEERGTVERDVRTGDAEMLVIEDEGAGAGTVGGAEAGADDQDADDGRRREEGKSEETAKAHDEEAAVQAPVSDRPGEVQAEEKKKEEVEEEKEEKEEVKKEEEEKEAGVDAVDEGRAAAAAETEAAVEAEPSEDVDAKDEEVAHAAQDGGYDMSEPMTLTIDVDFDTWGESDEERLYTALCGVVPGLVADEIEIIRVQRGSVVVDLMIYRADWAKVVDQMAADLRLGAGGGSQLAALGVSKMTSPSLAEEVMRPNLNGGEDEAEEEDKIVERPRSSAADRAFRAEMMTLQTPQVPEEDEEEEEGAAEGGRVPAAEPDPAASPPDVLAPAAAAAAAPAAANSQLAAADEEEEQDGDEPVRDDEDDDENVGAASRRPLSAQHDHWFRKEAVSGIELPKELMMASEELPPRPRSSSGVPGAGERRKQAVAAVGERPSTAHTYGRGSVAEAYKRPTSAARARGASAGAGEAAGGSGTPARVRRAAGGAGRATEAVAPPEAHVGDEGLGPSENYLDVEEEGMAQDAAEAAEAAQAEAAEETPAGHQTLLSPPTVTPGASQTQHGMGLAQDGGEAWGGDDPSLAQTRATFAASIDDSIAHADGDDAAASGATFAQTRMTIGSDYTLDEGTLSATMLETHGATGMSLDVGVEREQGLAGSGAHVLVESVSGKARELETRLEELKPKAKEIKAVDESMESTMAKTRKAGEAQAESEGKGKGESEEASSIPLAKGISSEIFESVGTKKATRKKSLVDQLEADLPSDVKPLTLKSLPLQFVGRPFGSLTEHELFGIGRSMAINTRRLMLQVGGHERCLRMMAAVDAERNVRIVAAQAFFRGHLSRKQTHARLQNYLQEKERKKQEEAMEMARNTGAALLLQRVTRGHMGRLLWRQTLHDKLEKIRIEREERLRYLQVNCSKQTLDISRVMRGHIGRNLFRLEKELAERERQLAQFDEMKNEEFDYEFDPNEDDEDDSKAMELMETANVDYGDDATPRGVTQWYEKIIYPERNYPWTKESIFNDVHKAASKRIQTAYRQHLARLCLSNARRQKRLKHAKNRTISARKIQGAYRSFKRTMAEERRRVETDLFNLRSRSAVKIQALYRGAIIRIRINRRRDRDAEVQRERKRVAAITIQALGRGYIERKAVLLRRREWAEERLVHKAATCIQARWRGVMARGRISRIKADHKNFLAEQAQDAKNAREARIVLIQAAFRGHLGRELFRDRLVEVTAQKRLDEVRRRRAAVAFQALFRGYIYRNRRRVQARASRLHHAANKLQKVYRGHIVRNDISRMRFMQNFGHMSGAVTLVANNYRMHLARRARAGMIEVMHQSGMARFLQSVYRGHLARELFRSRVHARYKINCTCVLQRAYRVHVARNLYWDLKQQANEKGAAALLQRVYRGHIGRNTVREYLEKKERERKFGAAVQIQKVYRGHVGRNAGRTERNKLKAQYNMGWLATYTEQLEKVADMEHWDLYKGSVVEIAHRVRDMYATFEYESMLKSLKEEGKEIPPPPPEVEALKKRIQEEGGGEGHGEGGEKEGEGGGEAAAAGEVDEEGDEDELFIPKQKTEEEEEEERKKFDDSTAAAGQAVAPQIHQALHEMAGGAVLEKPWNYGKAERMVKDLVELAEVTTEIRKEKAQRAYSTIPSPTKAAAASAAPAAAQQQQQQAAPGDAPGAPGLGAPGAAFDINLLLGKKKAAEVDYESPQVAPSYMKLQQGRPIPLQGTDGITGAPEFDVPERYAALRNRQIMPTYMHDVQVKGVDGIVGDPNPYLQDGPILLGSAADPFALPADDGKIAEQQRRRVKQRQAAPLPPKKKVAWSSPAKKHPAEWDASSAGTGLQASKRKQERERMLQEHERAAAEARMLKETSHLWADEVNRDAAARPSRSLPGPSPYDIGGGKIKPAKRETDSFRRDLTAAERASLEELRLVLGESKLISNVSPSLAEASGLDPEGLTLQYAPDSSLPIVMGATANAQQRDFELFMDPNKRRKATAKSKGGTKLPGIPLTGGATMPPMGYADFVPAGEMFELPDISLRPGSGGGMGRTL